jgi:hypothetical protein
MQRDQAMGRMGIFYVNLKQAHADLMTISCRCFEQFAEGIVKIPVFGQSGDFESETVDISALEGEAEAYPEGDENFPELWNQQRATMMKIMDTDYGKELAKDMGNAELFARMTGIPDLKIPGLDSWRKQLKEIAELTKIPGANEDPTAAIAPMVEVDPVNDDSVIEEACCGWWLNSDMGQKKKLLYPTGCFRTPCETQSRDPEGQSATKAGQRIVHRGLQSLATRSAGASARADGHPRTGQRLSD